ncbi:MAG: segregation/condensation protein A [Erysipelothrix sp.]|jgi:segregation and condensation protein A|nr:segregation/condensation protein A [Erysipelothrix sp.]
MSFSVTIDAFEGPLDLMLYLIRDKKLDLFNLDITELTNQYIDYIHQMQERELEIAAEYLSELAGLIEFKSKRLLPRDTSELESENPEEEASSIVKRLLEYQQIKDVSIELSERFLERQTHLDVPASYHTLEDNDKAELSLNNDIYDLIKAMSKLLTRRQQLSRSLEVRVTQNELSVDERIDQLRLFLSNQKDSFDLREIMRESYSLELQIVTFLAVLDLIRMSELVFSLGSDDNIMLKGV